MDVLKNSLFILLITPVLTGCQAGYYLSSAYNQVSLLASGVSVQDAMKDPNISEDEKRKLQLAQKVREFSESDLHLRNTDNYTSYVKLNRRYVTYVVSGSQKWELKHHYWKFPFVGKMPYKGYFNEEDAKKEEENLEKENLDTYLRGVSAYSTLGWFRDPLLSSMLALKDIDFVNTLIHETVHATVFIKSSADFNERMAVFLGNKGTELFYLKKEGPDSPTLKQIKSENEDDRLFSQFISKEIADLEEWYLKQTDKNESLRLARIKEIQERFKIELAPHLKTKLYTRFPKIKINNARLLMYKTYFEDLSDFEKLYKLVDQDFLKFVEKCRSLENSKEPEEDLKQLVSSPRVS